MPLSRLNDGFEIELEGIVGRPCIPLAPASIVVCKPAVAGRLYGRSIPRAIRPSLDLPQCTENHRDSCKEEHASAASARSPD